jgi:hypothetical protein
MTRWRQQGPPKCWYTTTSLHGVTTHKNTITGLDKNEAVNNHHWTFHFNSTVAFFELSAAIFIFELRLYVGTRTMRHDLLMEIGDRLFKECIPQSVQRLGYGQDDLPSIPGGSNSGIFLFATASRPALRTSQTSIQWEPESLSLGIKRPGRESDYSLPSSVEAKNVCIYISTPIRRLHGVVLN